jgi:hypothetical protein
MVDGGRETARWGELMTALPYGELDYIGEFWDKEWIEREVPKIEAEHKAARTALLAARAAAKALA